MLPLPFFLLFRVTVTLLNRDYLHSPYKIWIFESSTANIEHHKTSYGLYTLSSCVVYIVNTLHHLKSNIKQKGGVHCIQT